MNDMPVALQAAYWLREIVYGGGLGALAVLTLLLLRWRVCYSAIAIGVAVLSALMLLPAVLHSQLVYAIPLSLTLREAAVGVSLHVVAGFVAGFLFMRLMARLPHAEQ